MRKIFDFDCPCGHSTEALVAEEDTVECPNCQRPMRRLVSAPSLAIPGVDTGFPRASRIWDRNHESPQKRTRHI